MNYQYTANAKAQAILDYFAVQSSADVSELCNQGIIATFGDKKSLEAKIAELDAKSAALKAALG